MVSMRRAMAMTIAALVTVVGLALIVERGGILAWAGSILGATLLLKVCIRPSTRDYHRSSDPLGVGMGGHHLPCAFDLGVR